MEDSRKWTVLSSETRTMKQWLKVNNHLPWPWIIWHLRQGQASNSTISLEKRATFTVDKSSRTFRVNGQTARQHSNIRPRHILADFQWQRERVIDLIRNSQKICTPLHYFFSGMELRFRISLLYQRGCLLSDILLIECFVGLVKLVVRQWYQFCRILKSVIRQGISFFGSLKSVDTLRNPFCINVIIFDINNLP